jgi:acyl-CoA reductase-like NAD-dependent aldehyde dehydrogenase
MFHSHNPATGELVGTYTEHDEAETNVRLQRAWDGWRRWSRTPLHERSAFLVRLADLLEARAESYGQSNSPTAPTSASAPRSGAVTSNAPIASRAASNAGWCSSMTSSTQTRARRSAASRHLASVVSLACPGPWS